MIIAHLQASKRVGGFTNVSGDVYTTSVSYPVVSCAQDEVELTLASSSSVGVGEYYFDEVSQALYINSTDINAALVIPVFRFLFSDRPVNLSWDLGDTSQEYLYEPLISQSIGFSSYIEPSLIGVSLIGGGDIKLINNEDHFQSIFGNYFFEDREISIYEYIKDTAPSSSRTLYKGVITNKKYGEDFVSFRVKDNLNFLNEAVQLVRYTGTGLEVVDFTKFSFKKRVFGKVDSLALKSIDEIGPNFTLTGTHVGNAGTTTLTGTGTDYINEFSVGDKVVVFDEEYEVISVSSSTSLEVGKAFTQTFSGETLTNRYTHPIPSKNRIQQISQKPLHSFDTTMTEVIWFNRFRLSTVNGLREGDNVIINGETKEVTSISLNNTVTISTNLSTFSNIGENVTRSEVQNVYYDKRLISPTLYTVTNDSSDGCYLTLASNFEKDFFEGYELFSFSSTNWSAGNVSTITVTGAGFDSKIKPRDFISTDGGSNYYEVMDVSADFVKVRASVSQTGATVMLVKSVIVVQDSSILSADVYGETEDDDTSGGTLIETASQAIKKLLLETVDSSLLDLDSFDTAQDNESGLISYSFPSLDKTDAPLLIDIINDLNASVYGSLLLNNELKYKYVINTNEVDFDSLKIVSKYDAINYSILSTSNKKYRYINSFYRHEEYNPSLQDKENQLYELDFDFVRQYVGSQKTLNLDLYLYDQSYAEYITRKYALYNSLDNLEMEITLDKTKENNELELGEVIKIEFDLFTNLGSGSNQNKVVQIYSIENLPEEIKIKVVDLANMYVRRSVITPDGVNDFSSASEDQKLLYSYITDENGLIDNDIDTDSLNLIF